MRTRKLEECKTNIRKLNDKIYLLGKSMEKADRLKGCEIVEEIENLKRQIDVMEIYKEKLKSDIELESFKIIDFSKYEFPVISVYEKPKDRPNKYVARLWNGTKDTRKVIIKDTLKEIRELIPKPFIRFPPDEDDDPVIVEVYI